VRGVGQRWGQGQGMAREGACGQKRLQQAVLAWARPARRSAPHYVMMFLGPHQGTETPPTFP